MTLDQLRALDAVVVFGSIRSASEKLFKTPPAISSLIKNLEDDVGIQLLSRDGYRPKLTAEGEIFHAKARKVLRSADELKTLSQRIVGHEELIVGISVNAVCPLRVILNVLKKLEKKYQNTQINVSTEQMGGAMDRLKRGEVELAITTTADMVSGQMEAFPLMTIPIFPIAHSQHPLAGIKGLISRTEAAKYTQVIVSDSSRHAEKQSLDVIEESRQCHVTDFPAKKSVIEAKLGWGGLPEYLVSSDIEKGKLTRLHVQGFEVRNSHQYLIRRTDREWGIVAQNIWDSLLQQFDT